MGYYDGDYGGDGYQEKAPKPWKRYLSWPLTALLVALTAIGVIAVGVPLKVGGVFGALLGRIFGGKALPTIAVANTPPKRRKEAVGESDTVGFEQVSVRELEHSRNPFRRRDVVVLEDGRKVQLPAGVKDTDVADVIVVDSEAAVVRVKESTPTPTESLSPQELLDRLKELRDRRSGGAA